MSDIYLKSQIPQELIEYFIPAEIGLEATPDEFVVKLVAVFREVKRVLRDDGVIFVNLGDSYASQGGPEPSQTKWKIDGASNGQNDGKSRKAISVKPKDLYGIPWMTAFALRADGWYLRSDIIWAKGCSGDYKGGNVMPESVKDRPTRAHEYLFLLTKSARYFYDSDAVKEEAVSKGYEDKKLHSAKPGWSGSETAVGQKGHAKPGAWQINQGRNMRSVWTINTQPYSGAHFAAFPEKLVEPCIMAGCPIGGTVLDPFGGSGTVGAVAERLGRNSILIELNPEYVVLAEQRTAQSGLLLEVA